MLGFDEHMAFRRSHLLAQCEDPHLLQLSQQARAL